MISKTRLEHLENPRRNERHGAKWMRGQTLEPKCAAMDFLGGPIDGMKTRYVFDGISTVLEINWGGCVSGEHAELKDFYSGEVYATADEFGYDNVKCADQLMESLRGGKYARRKSLEKIVYKLMVGDIMLEEE